jgi:hypothetical protein
MALAFISEYDMCLDVPTLKKGWKKRFASSFLSVVRVALSLSVKKLFTNPCLV